MRDHRTDLRLMRQAADASPAAQHGQAEPAGPPRQPRLAAGKKAGR